jgi:hypothetical protein
MPFITRAEAARFLREEADRVLAGDPRDLVSPSLTWKIDPLASEGGRSGAERMRALRARRRVQGPSQEPSQRHDSETSVTGVSPTPPSQDGSTSGVFGSDSGSGSPSLFQAETGSSQPESAGARARARARASGSSWVVPVERDGEKSPSRHAGARRARPRSRFAPDDWNPRDAERALAKQLGVSLDHELPKFRDHEFARPRQDWDRTFANWLRTASERSAPPGLRQHQETKPMPYHRPYSERNGHRPAPMPQEAKALLKGIGRPV